MFTSIGLIIDNHSKKNKMVKLQLPETRKLSDSAKKLTKKAKKWENEPSLEAVSVQ